VRDTLEDKRWTDAAGDAPEELAELLRAGRDTLGTLPEVGELARRLSIVLGPASGLPGSGAPGKPAASDVGSGPSASSHAPSASEGPPVLANRLASAGGRGLGRLGAWVAAGSGAAIGVWLVAGALTAGPSTAPPASIEDGPAPVGVEAIAPPAPAPSAASSGVSPVAAVEPDAAAPTANEAGADTRGSSAAAPRPRAAARVHRPQLSSLAEAELLQRAQAALGTDPAAALALARRHQRSFRRGALVQEREVIAIEALKRLGRHDAASARAAAFERRYHGSLHRSRIERGSDTPAPPGDGLHTAP
jgi:hypothetical protein